ncbi:hypothetical protein BO82DRAFT_349678 [Aspergillus uvarum CBS 121591]|uniref:Uncharacterized protein n=2 Tax=Aspergillus subgen. Circumdati TaxID=2720871 RepID=A0A319D848_9EURO|nr:hypothetical protein BO82DRAFT_349678 [Aspergillus uvarum CBS 121591]PYH87163.1 hypothetical protein BO82DRAFT_349678 [Aspergillus uvarum CBS 121591]PYI29570.1 hypothetical protein BP00DRAFT_427325 [Aspergillus indologenus CBS 114.80]
MKPTTTLLLTGLLALATGTLADKTCTPSFDYCANKLLSSKGFTENDLKTALQGTGLENDDLADILFHCKNPGDVGHAQLCAGGCTDPATEGSHGCSG